MLHFQNVKKIYFVGIGGIGMSAVAGIAAHHGYEVKGSDGADLYEPAKSILSTYSIPYFAGYDKSHIEQEKPDLVVVGGGENAENVEIAQALAMQIPLTSFPEILSHFTLNKYRLVVAGTHGKTTTTALIALLLREMGYNPGFFIGGLAQDFGTNFRYTEGRFFVIEGDEYFSSFFDRTPKFWHYQPNLLALNNLEMDHFDYFSTKDQLLDAFRRLASGIPSNGRIIANADDENVRLVIQEASCPITWISAQDGACDWFAQCKGYRDGDMEFLVKKGGTDWGRFLFSKAGEHNMRNALAAIAVSQAEEIVKVFSSGKDIDIAPQDNQKIISSVLKKFRGAKRRFELISDQDDIRIIDDYAHHPTAVAKTLEAAKKLYPDSTLWAVFEPHTYSRTKATLPQLTTAFFAADHVIIPEVYAAREKHLKGLINGAKVVAAIKKQHKDVIFLPKREDVLAHLAAHLKKGDVAVIMSVGSFNELAYELKERLKEERSAR